MALSRGLPAGNILAAARGAVGYQGERQRNRADVSRIS